MAKIDLRELVSGHLKKAHGSESLRSWANAHKVPLKTAQNVEKKSNAANLDTLQTIAEACGMEPWQLLHSQGKNATTLDELSSEALRLARRIDALKSDPDRRRVALATMEYLLFSSPMPPAEIDEQDEAEEPAAPPIRSRHPVR